MKKSRKIKKYSPFIDRKSARKRRIFRSVVGLCILAGLFFAGWLLAEGALSGLFKREASSMPSSHMPSSSVSHSSSQAESDTPIVTDEAEGSVWGVVDHLDLERGQLDSTVESLKAAGVQYAVVTLKDSDGHIYYESAEPSAAAGVQQVGFNAGEVANALAQAGIRPVAAVDAFADPLAATTNRTMAVQLSGNSGYLWLDAAAASGGRAWLNPYNEEAQSYITGIISEVFGLGYSDIILDNFNLPIAYSYAQADFGAAAQTIAADQLLSGLASNWQNLAEQSGGRLWLRYSDTVLTGADTNATGASPLTFAAGRYIVTFNTQDITALWDRLSIAGSIASGSASQPERPALPDARNDELDSSFSFSQGTGASPSEATGQSTISGSGPILVLQPEEAMSASEVFSAGFSGIFIQ